VPAKGADRLSPADHRVRVSWALSSRSVVSAWPRRSTASCWRRRGSSAVTRS